MLPNMPRMVSSSCICRMEPGSVELIGGLSQGHGPSTLDDDRQEDRAAGSRALGRVLDAFLRLRRPLFGGNSRVTR